MRPTPIQLFPVSDGPQAREMGPGIQLRAQPRIGRSGIALRATHQSGQGNCGSPEGVRGKPTRSWMTRIKAEYRSELEDLLRWQVQEHIFPELRGGGSRGLERWSGRHVSPQVEIVFDPLRISHDDDPRQ